MNSTPLAPAQALQTPAQAGPNQRPMAAPMRASSASSTSSTTRATRTVHALLARLVHGTLRVHSASGGGITYGEAPAHSNEPAAGHAGEPGPTLHADIHLHHHGVYARVLQSGDIGLAESYVEGEWSTADLRALLELFMRNRENLERVIYGSTLGTLAYRLTHWWRRNSRRGSQRNVQAHYDLGNAFYAAWLDPTMNYSSAWFDGDASLPLPAAQHRKVARALDEAGVGPGSRLLEIGCGWGAVAEAAARRGAHTVGVTLSSKQLAYARTRLLTGGLASRADLRLQDYRDLAAEVAASGRRYDAIVSIEMFEAVGRAFWPAYFETLVRCLAPGGHACVQVIVIRNDLFPRYVRSTDFIQQYIFPGGLLPSAEVFRAEAAKGGLEVVRELAFGEDYARTLAHWRQAFQAGRERIAALGHDERFLRLWEFYLAYCEAAFASGQTDVVQFTLRHAHAPASGY